MRSRSDLPTVPKSGWSLLRARQLTPSSSLVPSGARRVPSAIAAGRAGTGSELPSRVSLLGCDDMDPVRV
jgi:hypothetical protein